jgi:GNAT superfamily N-acetyltransferase
VQERRLRGDAGRGVAAASEAPRTAVAADVDGLTNTLTLAFAGDPLWRWAFPELGTLEPLWRYFVQSALRYDWTWVAGPHAAASVWIPPGGTELTDAEEEQVEPMIRGLIGDRATEVMTLLERFEEAHPRERPHYYLSLLGTHPAHRGSGLGMALLDHNLARIDAEGAPAYLESSNPANDVRYERVGFEQVGELSTPDGAHKVATMWREARGAAG